MIHQSKMYIHLKSLASRVRRKYFLLFSQLTFLRQLFLIAVVEPGTSAWKKIKREFGDEVFLPSGHLNREKLGEIIFANVDKRRKLNEFTHPEIHRTIMFEVLKHFLSGNSWY